MSCACLWKSVISIVNDENKRTGWRGNVLDGSCGALRGVVGEKTGAERLREVLSLHPRP